MPDTRYYAVHVSNRATSRRGTAWVWSPGYDTMVAAVAAQTSALADDAAIAFIVIFEAGEKKIVRIMPRTAAATIRHYQDLVEMIQDR